jgi:anti-anti-sigma factor
MADSHVRTERLTDTIVVVRATGEVDLATAAPLRAALERAATDPTVRLLVCDLSGVTFLACNGLAILLAAQSTMDERGGELRVVATKPIVLRVFALTGLTETLGVAARLSVLSQGTR